MSVSWTSLRILVVDDDDGCRQCLATILSEEGHDIVTAARGWEALENARRLRQENKRLDLSILDFNMPDLTGIETFRRLLAEYPRLEAVFVTGDPSTSLEREIQLVGGRALMRKPLDVVHIRRIVHGFRGGPCRGVSSPERGGLA